jgi:hypothetical protein
VSDVHSSSASFAQLLASLAGCRTYRPGRRPRFLNVVQPDLIVLVDDGASLVNGGQRSILPSRFELNDSDALAVARLDAAARYWNTNIVASGLRYSRKRDGRAQ